MLVGSLEPAVFLVFLSCHMWGGVFFGFGWADLVLLDCVNGAFLENLRFCIPSF